MRSFADLMKRVSRALSLRASALGASLVMLMLGCRTPSTQIELFIGTDAPLGRVVSLQVLSFSGAVAADQVTARSATVAMGPLQLVRQQDGSGTFASGGSIGVAAPSDRTVNTATLWLRATVAATTDSPAILLDRVVRVSFVRGRAGAARVFLPISCGDRSIGCISTSAEQCTVSVRCREQGATCGDLGECVDPVVEPLFPTMDGGLDDVQSAPTVDATSGRTDVMDARQDTAPAMDVPSVASDVSGDVSSDVVMDVSSDVSDGCPANMPTVCASMCVDTNTNTDHCGRCSFPCMGDGMHAAACVNGQCTLRCAMGFQLVGGVCVSDTAYPRPIAPMSLGTVTRLRPMLRWELTAGFQGAMVDICRDRSCTILVETIPARGNAARPSAPLDPRRVYFWRLRGRIGMGTSTTNSPTWLFRTPAMSATGVADSSVNPQLDVNGDGFSDVLVGSYGADPGGRDTAGGVSVYHGSAMGVSSTRAWSYDGLAMFDQLGRAVSGAGDINGDGYGDIAVGAALADPGGRFAAGTVSVFYGSPTGIRPASLQVLEGVRSNDNFGASVATAGDVNGDGYADLVVGAPQAAPGGRANAGTASIFFGTSTGLNPVPMHVLEGMNANDAFGSSVATAGDLNGDGFGDLIVGAPQAMFGGRMATGTVSVFVGGMGGIAVVPQRFLVGAGVNDQFGISVASAGDVNNDGYGDIVVGAFAASPSGRANVGSAGVYLGSVNGADATANQVFEGVAMGDRFGESVAGAGDVNGDGFGDIVVGASAADPMGRPNAGTATVYLGNVMGISALQSRVLEGSLNNDQFGVSAGGAGDVNGDGFSDVFVGAWLGNPNMRQDVGSVGIFHGSNMGIITMPAVVLEGLLANDYFGASVAALTGVRRRCERLFCS